MSERRDFLKKSALLSLGSLAASIVSTEKMQAIEHLGNEHLFTEDFTLAPLPYAYDALEPFIDKQTMELHHVKHHQAYVNNLNKALTDAKVGGVLLEVLC